MNPRGQIHIPIGIPNTLDTLKTFVEPEGCFSPGVATYGVYFWFWDVADARLVAATMEGISCEWSLADGCLIPWSRWQAGSVIIKMEVCHVVRPSPAGNVHVVGARVHLAYSGEGPKNIAVYAALRPIGPAGGPIEELTVSDTGDALLVNGHPALVARARPSAIGVMPTDAVGDLAREGRMPSPRTAVSETGDCSGIMRLEEMLKPGKTTTLHFVCPVLAGRRAVGHDWDGTSSEAQFDLAKPNPPTGGSLQPDPGLEYYRRLSVDVLFAEARSFWQAFSNRVVINLPDPRWEEAWRAILGHVSMVMNEDAPDVAVVNYNVFNRDGVYTTNVLQKAGRFDLAAAAINYFLVHPFNGRVDVEADNPGQVLWIMGEHWRLSRDEQWLRRVYPSAAKLAAMIRYYRTTAGPHYVKAASLEFGEALPPDEPGVRPADRRQVLKPGRCDGVHPEYTEAFDIAGLRAAAVMAQAAGQNDDARTWQEIADDLFRKYDERFAGNLPKGYGNYSVLWPCRLYPLDHGTAYEQFRMHGACGPNGWRYFPLATAHQGLLTGNRHAGHETIARHLDHPQMRGWYMFDEGGKSGAGGWPHVRTPWKHEVAMPHGWAVAELWLLIRDSLCFEDRESLVLLGGIPPDWFMSERPIIIENFPTYWGTLSMNYVAAGHKAILTLTGQANPPAGYRLRLPVEYAPSVWLDQRLLNVAPTGDVVLPPGTQRVNITYESG